MAGPKIRTVLIEDSGFMRILLSDLLRKDEHIELVATAANGLEGVEKVRLLKPDVVVTDMVMPQYDGLYVVQQLMRTMPLPIILLSSLDRADQKIFDALREGAFDFLDKPQGIDGSEGYLPLTKMVREASITDYLKLRQLVKGRNTSDHTFDARLQYDIIVVGSSTGGPGAIEMTLNNFPKNLSIPVIIAQHMPERFIETFANRLRDSTGLQIGVARDGQYLLGNHVYLAPGSSNIRIELSGSSRRVKYVSDIYKEFNNPSIDCLFESVADSYGSRAVGVILTGMGKDGALGLRKIRSSGGLTISQDEASSVVYGMPKAAFETGAATYQIALAEIPGFIISAL